jgi:site-specific recombinase XerD
MHVDENRQHGGRPRYLPQQPRRTDLIIPNPKLKLLDQVREVMRLKHYSIRTERSYCDWIRRYIHFHRMKLREELLAEPESKMELFLSDLAVNGHVAASTQNQAFNALLFLYTQILQRQLDSVQAVRADRPVRVPVVLTPEEVKQVLSAMSGDPQLVAKTGNFPFLVFLPLFLLISILISIA